MGNLGTRNSSKQIPIIIERAGDVDMYIAQRYSIGRTLGEGASSRVLECTEISTGKKFALKTMDKGDRQNKVYFEKEIMILKLLQHPNIMSFKESHVDSNHFYIVSELCAGGDLFERMMDPNWRITENRISQLIWKMLLTIEHLHSRQIVHRDIKPENFMFKTRDADSKMLLIDFGCAKIVRDHVRYRGAFGTPYWLAPEIAAGRKFTRTGRILKFSDVWSIGVIAYVLMTGQVPFPGVSTEDIFESILKKPLHFTDDGNHLSKSFIDFCQRMLIKAPHKRLRVKEALNHPWVQGRGMAVKNLPVGRIAVDIIGDMV